MVRDCENTDLITNYCVDDAERESSRYETASLVAPYCADARVLQDESYRALELCEKRLR